MELIKNYNNALKNIYAHVGFKEDWVVYPIKDLTNCKWHFVDKTFFDNKKGVRYSDNLENLKNETGDYYEDSIYTQRFYNKHIYKGDDFTLIFCDTHTDGMKYFSIFKNKNHIHELDS